MAKGKKLLKNGINLYMFGNEYIFYLNFAGKIIDKKNRRNHYISNKRLSFFKKVFVKRSL